ncbi:MAG: hypothetical protein HAW60_04785 [Bdellovibrionales bacterium]|nr:hypothetical protein [Bdellovibrionales bacterium]
MTKNKFVNPEQSFAWEPSESYHKDENAKSFYFFDIDENILNLSSSIYLKHQATGKMLRVSGKSFIAEQSFIGSHGPFKDYHIDFSTNNGSFQEYRDQNIPWWKKPFVDQSFIQDIKKSIKLPDSYWQGPSWAYFCHAVLNQRPVALITARGHSTNVLKKGLSLLVKYKHLPCEPNYLDIYAVNSPSFLNEYAENQKYSTAELKNIAIGSAVKKAFTKYGFNKGHRFGMSDDDAENLKHITMAMSKLKKVYPQNSFFVFDTKNSEIIKKEL